MSGFKGKVDEVVAIEERAQDARDIFGHPPYLTLNIDEIEVRRVLTDLMLMCKQQDINFTNVLQEARAKYSGIVGGSGEKG